MILKVVLGPESVGKWELAEYTRRRWNFKKEDTLRIKRLTQDNARFASKFASERPTGWRKLIIVHLDKKATVAAQNALLKSMEESPDATYILVSEEPPISTVMSRATTYRFGLLSDKEVFDILTVRLKFSDERAEVLARVSGGQVRRALSYSKDNEGKIVVIRALDAVHRRDSKDLESIAPLWQQEHTDLLIRWCYEALTKKWKLFIPEESNIRGTKIPLRILIALREDLRPRLVVRSALASVLQGT